MLRELRARIFGRSVFREVFTGEAGAFVLADLRGFCGAKGRDVYCAPDGRIFLALTHPHFEPSSAAEQRGENLGRLRVYERIQRHVRMSDDQIEAAEREAVARIQGGIE